MFVCNVSVNGSLTPCTCLCIQLTLIHSFVFSVDSPFPFVSLYSTCKIFHMVTKCKLNSQLFQFLLTSFSVVFFLFWRQGELVKKYYNEKIMNTMKVYYVVQSNLFHYATKQLWWYLNFLCTKLTMLEDIFVLKRQK